MLAYPSNARIFFYGSPVDLRKGFEGLSYLAESSFEDRISGGAFFVFINKSNSMMKILYWDHDGLAIWHKRLEKGRFNRSYFNKPLLDRREFLMLLEGVIPQKIGRRFRLN